MNGAHVGLAEGCLQRACLKVSALQLEFITLTNLTGRPEFAARTEAIIQGLHQKLPNQVCCRLVLARAFFGCSFGSSMPYTHRACRIV